MMQQRDQRESLQNVRSLPAVMHVPRSVRVIMQLFVLTAHRQVSAQCISDTTSLSIPTLPGTRNVNAHANKQT